ncbi:MAG: biopolymer transporter ExbD [Bacteroidota bacterium]
MGLKKRNKVNAEFSMSSLTDIIFLLLIFFMLTANFVQVQPFDLPESESKTVAPVSAVVTINNAGEVTLNNIPISIRAIERALRQEVRRMDHRENVTITIVAEKGVPFEQVKEVMKVAGKLKVKAIIATQPKS